LFKFTKKNIGISSIIILLVLMILLVNVFDFDFYLFRWLENGVYNLLAVFIGTIPVHIADNPLDCVVRGTGIALEELDNLKRVLISPRKIS